MPDHSVIGDVSATLTSMFTDPLSALLPAPPPIAQVHDLMGNIATDPALLTVFLYEVRRTHREEPPAAARECGPGVPPLVRITRASLALTLRYLITPWSTDRLTDQQILGPEEVDGSSSCIWGPAAVSLMHCSSRPGSSTPETTSSGGLTIDGMPRRPPEGRAARRTVRPSAGARASREGARRPVPAG